MVAWALFIQPRITRTPFHDVSGGLILGAMYMATDMATSPVTPKGMWVYGGLIGLLTVVIRYYSGLPEGVMYAILLGNAATPLIERITQPTPFGKAAAQKARRSASYSLHPGYISREEASATPQKKRIFRNKPKRDERRKPKP
jgi:electron transport complex protein RnfD